MLSGGTTGSSSLSDKLALALNFLFVFYFYRFKTSLIAANEYAYSKFKPLMAPPGVILSTFFLII